MLAALLLLAYDMDRQTSEAPVAWRENEAILPAQVAARRPIEPERRLMLAVLQEAVVAYLRAGASSVWGSRAEIVRWFESDDASWPYAFVNLCDALGLESSAVRQALRRRRAARRGW